MPQPYGSQPGAIPGTPYSAPQYPDPYAAKKKPYPLLNPLTDQKAGLAGDGTYSGPGSIDILSQAPDYSGILASYLADSNARINAGLDAYRANRISGARAAVNRLGVRDPHAMAGRLAQYGIRPEDLQQAYDNPWSDLKALDLHARRAGAMLEAQRAARGTWRSGGTIAGLTNIENERARGEAQSTEDMMSQLAQGLYGESEWERQQRDAAEQAATQMQVQLASSYQPFTQTAVWSPQHGGYVANGKVYDQSGKLIGNA